MALQVFDLYSIRKGKDDKTFFPPIGIAFLGEKEDGTPKLSIQLNMFPDTTYHGSIKKPKEDHKNPDW